MDVPPTLGSLTGVLDVIVTAERGRVVAHTAETPAARTTAEVCSRFRALIDPVGARTGLGTLVVATVRAGRETWVVGFGVTSCAAVRVEGGQPLGPVEAALRAGAWERPYGPASDPDESPSIPVEVAEPSFGPSEGVVPLESPLSRNGAARTGFVPKLGALRPPRLPPRPAPHVASGSAFGAESTPAPAATPPPPAPRRASDDDDDNSPTKVIRRQFSGSLQELHLPDLLEFLRSARKTGTLVCRSGMQLGAVNLRMGKLTGATAPSTRPITDYLEAARHGPRASLLPLHAGGEAKTGPWLVEAGLATREEVRAAMTRQAREALAEMLRWSDGSFTFTPNRDAGTGDELVEFALDPRALLLDLYREADGVAGRA